MLPVGPKYLIETPNKKDWCFESPKISVYDSYLFYCNEMENLFPTTVKFKGICCRQFSVWTWCNGRMWQNAKTKKLLVSWDTYIPYSCQFEFCDRVLLSVIYISFFSNIHQHIHSKLLRVCKDLMLCSTSKVEHIFYLTLSTKTNCTKLYSTLVSRGSDWVLDNLVIVWILFRQILDQSLPVSICLY